MIQAQINQRLLMRIFRDIHDRRFIAGDIYACYWVRSRYHWLKPFRTVELLSFSELFTGSTSYSPTL